MPQQISPEEKARRYTAAIAFIRSRLIPETIEQLCPEVQHNHLMGLYGFYHPIYFPWYSPFALRAEVSHA